MNNNSGTQKTALERAIKASDYTAAALAREIGVEARTLHNWRKGVTLPAVDKALLIAQALGKQVRDIFPLKANS